MEQEHEGNLAPKSVAIRLWSSFIINFKLKKNFGICEDETGACPSPVLGANFTNEWCFDITTFKTIS